MGSPIDIALTGRDPAPQVLTLKGWSD